MQRWVAVGFTEAQAELLDELVTKEYLRGELLLLKREMLFWVLGMLAPLYASMSYLLIRLHV